MNDRLADLTKLRPYPRPGALADSADPVKLVIMIPTTCARLLLSIFLLSSFPLSSAFSRVIRFLPLQDGDDLLLAGSAAPDALGWTWRDLPFQASGWAAAERDWHPHWCGGGIVNPQSDEAPLCGSREGLGGGFVPWITPEGLGWTLDLSQVVLHRRIFRLPGAEEGLLGQVLLWASADDIPDFFINGHKLEHRVNGYGAWGLWDISSLVKPGRNVLASQVIQMSSDSPCALTYLIEAEFRDRSDLVLAPVGSDSPLTSGSSNSWPAVSGSSASGSDSSDSAKR